MGGLLTSRVLSVRRGNIKVGLSFGYSQKLLKEEAGKGSLYGAFSST